MLFKIIAAADGILLGILSLFSVNRYVLLRLFRRHAHQRDDAPMLPDAGAPRVTVQLPVFNEYYVVERVIASACELDYPRELLEIQVLDDSTDETLALTRDLVSRYHAQGINIVHLHREDRTGYKAGALSNGLERAHGEFVAIFDADFVIPRDFLRRTLPYFREQDVGCVQTRWTHLNEDYSILTRATAFGLDGQFLLEQPARSRGGLFLSFNGTAAVLRTACIANSGGWHHDTLTEDLDLSYRAQIRGWRIKYLSEVTCDSEIPADIHGLKAQQFRWTKGTQQTARKILPLLWRSDVSLWRKAQGTIHLLGNSVYPFLVAVAILNPLMVVAAGAHHVRLVWPLTLYFLFALYGTFRYYLVAQRMAYKDWRRRLTRFPVFLAASIGMSVSNAHAAIEGLRGKASPFVRTPKYDLKRKGESWRAKRYRSALHWRSTAVELVLGSYTIVAMVYAIGVREYGAVPFLLLFGAGYLMVGLCSVSHVLALTIPSDAESWWRTARVAARAIVPLTVAVGVVGALSCGDGDREETARDAVATAFAAQADSLVRVAPVTGFTAIPLVEHDAQSQVLAPRAGSPTGMFYYRDGAPLEWRISASNLLPGRAYRVELKVEGTSYSVATLRADSRGSLRGAGTLDAFEDRVCVGPAGNAPTPLAGTHEVSVAIKDDGAPRTTRGKAHSIAAPSGEALPCGGNGDGSFVYRLFDAGQIRYRGDGSAVP